MTSIMGNFEGAGEAGDFCNAVTAAPGLEAMSEALDGAWIGIAGRAHLNGSGACQEEFDNILWGGDAAHAEDGDGDGAGALVDHAQSDGLDGRT